jgi:predicted deacylase
MTALRVAGLEVESGQRGTKVARVPAGETDVDVPIVAVNGRRDGPRVAITGGVHGAEYVGIEAARWLALRVDPEEVSGSLVVVPIANTTAFYRRSIYTSGLDDRNLNRSFPGRLDGSPSEALAHWLFQTVIRPSQYYIDLHGGDMIEALVPFVIYLQSENPEVEGGSRRMALATGIPRVIRSLTAGSTYAAATAAGIPSILAEVGGQGVWSEELVEQHVEGVMRVLRHLGVLSGEPPALGEPRVHDTFAWSRADVSGLFYPLMEVGDRVQRGQLIGRVTDYFGKELQRVEAAVDGEVAFLVTSLAMNAGDPLLAIIA